MEKITFEDGVYEGEAINEVPHGNGVFVYNSGAIKIEEGVFEDGLLVKGKRILTTGGVFEGSFDENGLAQGVCTTNLKDAVLLEATYKDGKMQEGKGKITVDGETFDCEIEYKTSNHTVIYVIGDGEGSEEDTTIHFINNYDENGLICSVIESWDNFETLSYTTFDSDGEMDIKLFEQISEEELEADDE